MSSMDDDKGPQVEAPENVAEGELLYCGGTSWESMGRKTSAPAGVNLVSPTRLRPLIGVDIRFVASGCTSCHCVALDVEGRCYTWGRNEKGQLGHGDTRQRSLPTIVSQLSKYQIVTAGAGRNHTVVVTDDGKSYSFGWNKHGQLGSGSLRNEIEPSPVLCQVSQVTNAVCGADFTVWLSSVEGSSILTAGLPQYGQLGHGTDNEYNVKDSSVKLAYEAQPRPRAIAAFAQKTVVKVACGTNHTVAVDSSGFVYTWGFGGYGRLGHREQKDEWVPRLVEVFQKRNVLPPNAIVSAGSVNSACTAGESCMISLNKMQGWVTRQSRFLIQDFLWMFPLYPQPGNIAKLLYVVLYLGGYILTKDWSKMAEALFKRGGQLYMWGKIKTTGDDWMYPKPVMDLSGWNIRCMDSGNMHHVIGADDACISWGHAQYGELGYGPLGPKSSANPKKVEILDHMHVMSVACGLGLSLIVVDRAKAGDRLEQLEIYEGAAAVQGDEGQDEAVATEKKTTRKAVGNSSTNSRKRKNKDSSSESEDMEDEYEDSKEDSNEDSDDENGDINSASRKGGGKSSSRARSRGAKKTATETKNTGRGRGRPKKTDKSLGQHEAANASSGRRGRGRPRKNNR